MKILVLSQFGEIVDVCRRMVEEGHNVDLFIRDKELQYIGLGFVNKISEVRPTDFRNYDLIIFDDSCWGDIPLNLMKHGLKVIGGSLFTDRLEEDREGFYRIMNLAGIKTPKIVSFDKVGDAVRYIKRYPNEYVLKSYNEDKSITVLAKDKHSLDIIEFLTSLKEIKKIFLQEKVKGVEVAISSFFNGEEFIPPVIINYEHKKFGNRNTGVFTGEMGTVLVWKEVLKCKFFDETLNKVQNLLKGKYVGVFDMNCIVNTTGCYVLEATPRFGYPITDIMSTNIKSWSDLFLGLVNKEYDCVLRNLIYKDGASVGVVLLAISPLEKRNCLLGLPLISVNKEPSLLKNFSVFGVIKDKDKYYVAEKYLGVVSVTDKNIELARQKVYSLVSKITVPDLFYYRTDIGENIFKQHRWLEGIGMFS